MPGEDPAPPKNLASRMVHSASPPSNTFGSSVKEVGRISIGASDFVSMINVRAYTVGSKSVGSQAWDFRTEVATRIEVQPDEESVRACTVTENHGLAAAEIGGEPRVDGELPAVAGGCLTLRKGEVGDVS